MLKFFCITNEISFTIISLSSDHKLFLESWFLLGVTNFLPILSGIFLGLHVTSDINSAYFNIFFLVSEIYYGWCLRYLHCDGASFVFLFIFLHLGRAISYASYVYKPNTWFSGIIIYFFLMGTAFMGYVLPNGQMRYGGLQ